MAARIEDYALLSNCHSAALVSRDGSIDWFCVPRFDSGACFAALLGDETNGRWSLRPQGEYQASRKYIDGTLVLETIFETGDGSCKVTDCLLIYQETPILVREVEGLRGRVKMNLDLVLRFDYGSIIPWVRRLENGNGIRAIAGPDALKFQSPVPLQNQDLRTGADFTVESGQKFPFVLTYYPSFQPPPADVAYPHVAVRKTIYWWKEWTDRSTYHGPFEKEVSRSLLTLKALIYRPTGGIVAAPTTSLPENLSGVRNWDYRYCWLRDSTFTLYALLSAGYREEAERWGRWLIHAVAGTPSQVNILYGLAGERRLTEVELGWLSGYENSAPVRIGNAAYSQFQLDIFGELMDTLELARRNGLAADGDVWSIQREMMKYVAKAWQEPDDGIWEIRGPRRQFTYSKVMAWVAIDRMVKRIEAVGGGEPIEDWITLRDRIHRDVCENGYNSKLKSFTQYYGSTELDASLLMLSLVGFLEPGDERLKGTVAAIQKNLVKDGLVLRYCTSSGVDGITGDEGAFLACSFWLADNLILLKRMDEARELFHHLNSLRNDVGLYSEEFCTKRKRLVGNFPQAFSHISHVNTAMNLTSHRGPAGDRSNSGRRGSVDWG